MKKTPKIYAAFIISTAFLLFQVQAASAAMPNIGYNLYYGDLQSHTTNSDGIGTPSETFSHAKNSGIGDFFAVTDHNYSVTDAEWSDTRDAASSNTDSNFVSIAGMETEVDFLGESGEHAELVVFNTNDYLTNQAKDDPSMSLPDFYDWLTDRSGSIGQWNHPDEAIDFDGYNHFTSARNDHIKLIEYCNYGHRSVGTYESDYIEALDMGWRIAPACNSDTHLIDGLTGYQNRTVVLATELSQANIFDAIRNLRIFGTQDNNLKLIMRVNNSIMGSTLDNPNSLSFSIYAQDGDSGDNISKIDVIAEGGEVVKTVSYQNTNEVTLNFDISPQYKYYFVEVTEEDGNMAATSPIFINSSGGGGGGGANSPPAATITSAPAEGATVNQGTVLNFSGTASDSDSSNLTVSWYIDRIGDGLGYALIKQGTQSSGSTSGTVTMTGTKTNVDGATISLQDAGAVYDLILIVSDGVNTEVQAARSFVLGGTTSSCGDGTCNNGETCSTCSEDCGTCSPVPPLCGDQDCNNGETCSSCSQDCGTCQGTNKPPTLSITDPPTDGGSVKTGTSFNFSGNVSDTDSSSIKVSWYIDRMGDGLEKALIKEGNQLAGTTSGSVAMTGTKTNINGEAINFSDVGATYNLVLVASDGSNSDVEVRRSFTLSGYNLTDFTNLVQDWLKTLSGSPADVNLDNKVNSRDLGIMMSNWAL